MSDDRAGRADDGFGPRRGRRARVWLGTLLIALAMLSLTLWLLCLLKPLLVADYVVYNSTQRMVVRDDRLLFTANAYQRPPVALGTDHWNRRGYLVEVALPTGSSDANSVRIIGPIWTGPTPELTKFALPWQRSDDATEFVFSPAGRLEKTRVAADGQLSRWRLETGEHQAHWVADHELPSVEANGWSKAGGVFVSRSGAVLVRVSGEGEVTCYDLSTNAPLDDPWLTDAAHDAWKRNAPGRLGATVLTDDLDYIVSFSSDGSGEYTIGKEKYSRQTHGLVYHRPDLEPKLISKPEARMSGLKPEYLSYDGTLMLLDVSDESLELKNCLSGEKKIHRFKEPVGWLAGLGISLAGDASGERIVLVRLPTSQSTHRTDKATAKDQPLNVLVWTHKTDDVQELTLASQDWFQVRLGGYYPVRVVPVDSAEQ